MAKKFSELRMKMSPAARARARARAAKAIRALRRAAKKRGLGTLPLGEINEEIRAVRESRQREWLAKNCGAVKSYNRRIRKRGTFARP